MTTTSSLVPRPATELVPGYVLERLVSSRQRSDVWRAKGLNGLAAIKIVRLPDGTLSGAQLERLAWQRRIRHANLLPLYDYWIRSPVGRFISADELVVVPPAEIPAAEVVLALAWGESSLTDELKRYVGSDREEFLLLRMYEAARAVDWLNNSPRAAGGTKPALPHGNIKPSNLLIRDNSLALSDFGFLCPLSAETPRTDAKTRDGAEYLAPEVLFGGCISERSDQYALTLTLLELWTERFPIKYATAEELKDAKTHLERAARDELFDLSEFGQPAQKAILQALSVEPDKRFPAALELIQRLQTWCKGPMDDYRLLRIAGGGGEGSVWEASGPGGVTVALKKVHQLDSAGLKALRLQREKKLSHPHIAPLLGIWVTDENGNKRSADKILQGQQRLTGLEDVWVATTFADGGSLADFAADRPVGIPADELLTYIDEIAEALDYLNGVQRIHHRDVKPSNILLAGGHAVLGDLGLVRPRGKTGTDSGTSVVGTLPYAAPELQDGLVHATCDQYSLAMTFLELYSRRFPIDGDVPLSQWQNAKLKLFHTLERGEYALAPMSPSLQAALARALAPDPRKRYHNCGEMVMTLRDAALRDSPPNVKPRADTPTEGADGHGPAIGRRRAHLLLAMAIALTGILGLFVWPSVRSPSQSAAGGTGEGVGRDPERPISTPDVPWEKPTSEPVQVPNLPPLEVPEGRGKSEFEKLIRLADEKWLEGRKRYEAGDADAARQFWQHMKQKLASAEKKALPKDVPSCEARLQAKLLKAEIALGEYAGKSLGDAEAWTCIRKKNSQDAEACVGDLLDALVFSVRAAPVDATTVAALKLASQLEECCLGFSMTFPEPEEAGKDAVDRVLWYAWQGTPATLDADRLERAKSICRLLDDEKQNTGNEIAAPAVLAMALLDPAAKEHTDNHPDTEPTKTTALWLQARHERYLFLVCRDTVYQRDWSEESQANNYKTMKCHGEAFLIELLKQGVQSGLLAGLEDHDRGALLDVLEELFVSEPARWESAKKLALLHGDSVKGELTVTGAYLSVQPRKTADGAGYGYADDKELSACETRLNSVDFSQGDLTQFQAVAACALGIIEMYRLGAYADRYTTEVKNFNAGIGGASVAQARDYADRAKVHGEVAKKRLTEALTIWGAGKKPASFVTLREWRTRVALAHTELYCRGLESATGPPGHAAGAVADFQMRIRGILARIMPVESSQPPYLSSRQLGEIQQLLKDIDEMT